MRVYTISLDAGSITLANGDYDLFTISPGTNKPCVVLSWELAVLSELGDAQEEWLRLTLVRGHTTVGSGGNTVTPVRVDAGDALATFTARSADPTIGTGGTTTTPWAGGFNVRAGHPQKFLPEERIWVTAAQTSMTLRLMAAVADDLTLSGTMWVGEIG